MAGFRPKVNDGLVERPVRYRRRRGSIRRRHLLRGPVREAAVFAFPSSSLYVEKMPFGRPEAYPGADQREIETQEAAKETTSAMASE